MVMMVSRAFLTLALLALANLGMAATNEFRADYEARLQPDSGRIAVTLKLTGDKLPGRITLRIDPKRHLDLKASDRLEVKGNEAVWRPRGKSSRLQYDFVVNHRRSAAGYDSYMTDDWAIFRGDRMVPRLRISARAGLESRATLKFILPDGWSVVTPYEAEDQRQVSFDNPARRLDRPEGWLVAGRLGVRREHIGPVHALVAGPAGMQVRRQDLLAFLNWNLPHLLAVFPEFPQRILIVSGNDPMWRGGLSGPTSLYLHASRPLITENRTSPLLHELGHVALGIRSDGESDWIVEGLTEFYSIETLRRSGGISQLRYDQALEALARQARRNSTLFRDPSTGDRTAHAVLVFKAADEQIRRMTGGKASMDQVATALAAKRGEVSLKRLQEAAAKVAGKPVPALSREALEKPVPAPSR